MTQRRSLWLIALTFGALFVVGHLTGQTGDDCLPETGPVAGMQWEEIAFVDDTDAEQARLRVRIAATDSQRSAGMQHLCPEAVADNPILFVFSGPQRPAFHMSNVHAPLDMVFIDPNDRVVELHVMEPGPRLTRPEVPVRHALELAKGQASTLGIEPGLTLRRGAEEGTVR